MKMNLKHISGLVLNQPLLVTPNYAETILAVIGERLGVDNEGMVIHSGEAREGNSGIINGTKVIPIIGSMSHRSTGLEAMSGMTSYNDLQTKIEDAFSDPDVKSILFDYDSPGGMVSGAFDLRDYLMEQRGRKPMYAIAQDTMASAAYLLGSTADKVYATQTSNVGSIGVVAMHVDQTEADAKAGIKPTFIHAGKYKVAGNPHEPMTEDTLSYLQESVNDSYDMFVNAVAEARDIDPDNIRATEARVYKGQTAKKKGLVDQVASYRSVMKELGEKAQDQSTKYYLGNPQKGHKMEKEELDKLMADLETLKEQATLEAGLKEAAETKVANLEKMIAEAGMEIDGEALKVKAAPEMIEVYGQMVEKASLPDVVVKALEEAEKEKAESALTDKAKAELPNFAQEDAKTILKAVSGLGEAGEKVMASLKAADALLAEQFQEKGEAKPEVFESASEKLDAMIQDYMAEHSVNKAKATAEVTKSGEGRELMKKAIKEKK